MYTVIGNLKDTEAQYLNKTIQSSNNTTSKIYGVYFDKLHQLSFVVPGNGISSSSQDKRVRSDDTDEDIYNRYSGIRLLDSKGYNFSPSTTTDPGVDDFMTNNAGPFMIRECCTRYNSSTGKQEVVSYEGDSTWDTDKVNTEYNRMIEFPKFYYYRPNPYTFLVSSDPVKNFLPSPMHYRNGILYDHVYVSKDCLSSNYISGQVKPTSMSASVEDINTLRTTLINDYGFYLADTAVYDSILMLMMIKYNTFEVGRYALSYSSTMILASEYDNILSKDGSMVVSDTRTYKIGLGLINFGNGNFMDGMLGYHKDYKGDIYVAPNNSILTAYPISNASSSTSTITWTKILSTGDISLLTAGCSFDLNIIDDYEYIIIPKSIGITIYKYFIPTSTNFDYSSVLEWGTAEFDLNKSTSNNLTYNSITFNILDDAVSSTRKKYIRVYCYCD